MISTSSECRLAVLKSCTFVTFDGQHVRSLVENIQKSTKIKINNKMGKNNKFDILMFIDVRSYIHSGDEIHPICFEH